MNPFRCSNCDKLLGMIEGKAEIKCSKCKTMNRLGFMNEDYPELEFSKEWIQDIKEYDTMQWRMRIAEIQDRCREKTKQIIEQYQNQVKLTK